MKRVVTFGPLIVLVAIMLTAGIAATPAQLAVPAQPTVAATANGGELSVSWNRVAGAQFYYVGWANRAEVSQMTGVGREWLDAFHFVTVPALYTNHTVEGIKPGTEYAVMVGAAGSRFGGSVPVWSGATFQTTAGQHGAGVCPITGLPLPPVGYLGVGDSVTSSIGSQSFTLNNAAAPSTINLTYANNPNQQFSPRPGRRFVQVCGVYTHNFRGEARLYEAFDTVMDSDTGVGFLQENTYSEVSARSNSFGCEIWDIPASAQTAVYVVGLGAFNSQSGVAGADTEGVGLFQINLAEAPTTFIPTTTSAQTTLTPLSSQELTNRVKPALAQIVVTDADGNTGTGTGFIVRSDGIMVTNRHVVDDAQTVQVNLNTLDGRLLELTGTVLGRGILADLAVVRLPAGRTYATLPLANSDEVSGADEVTAWGYPASSISGSYPTITRGIISSKRIYGDLDFLQTDAAINPGNSGSPLIDQYGRVVGVNTRKTVHESFEGQGFAITSNEVRERLPTLINGGLSRETYRNARFGYGYSLDIPQGWYLDRENSWRTWFSPYHSRGSSRIQTWDDLSGLSRNADTLAALAEWRWRDLRETAQEEEWTLFDPVNIRPVGTGNNRHYRLHYRMQSESRFCISDRVEIIALSSTRPANLGFSMMSSVCERHLNQYNAQRDSILNSFRP